MKGAIERLRRAYHAILLMPHRLRPSNGRLVRQYLAAPGIKKLHLGCGTHCLPGWLNTDVKTSSTVAWLDISRPFPFVDAVFDYVFTEHAIEHLPYADGLRMLQESCRVLRPGGRIRAVTPDFQFLKDLHTDAPAPLQRDYMDWTSRVWLGGRAPAYAAMHVINNFFRDWGHQFIYDRRCLMNALVEAGFTDVRVCELQSSDQAELRGLENEAREPEGFLRLESIILEGVKPLP